LTQDQRLVLVSFVKETSFIDETETLKRYEHVLPTQRAR